MMSFLRKIYSFTSIFFWVKVQRSWQLNCTQVCFKPCAWLNTADLSFLTVQQTDSMLQVMVIAMIVFLEEYLYLTTLDFILHDVYPLKKKISQHKPVKTHASFADFLSLLFIISLHWANCWIAQSLVLQEMWMRQYSVFQNLCMKNWTNFTFVVCSGVYVTPDIIQRNLWLLTFLLQTFFLHGRLFSMYSFVRDPSLQLVESTEKWATLLTSLFFHLSI